MPTSQLPLQSCFNRIQANGLKLNVAKCNFGQENVPYLGFTLTPKGILPGQDKTEAIKHCPPPATVRQVREFLGLCNYFRASVKGFAHIAAPLNRLLTNESEWKGGKLPPEEQKAFETLQEKLLNPPVLAYPNPKLDYHLMEDASIGSEDIPGGI